MKTIELKNKSFSQACRVKKTDANRTLTFQISTERVSLDDGVLLADGMKSVDYMQNPIVLLNHDYGAPIGKTVRLERNADGWEADVQFPPTGVNADADRTFDFYSWMGHGAASVGFLVTARSAPTEEEKTKYGFKNQWAWIGREWKLLEWSIVAVPADPGATMKMAGAEGRALRSAMAAAMSDRMLNREAEADDEEESEEASTPKEKDDSAKPDGMAEMKAVLQELKSGQATIAGALAQIAEVLGTAEKAIEVDDEDDESKEAEEKVTEKSAEESALYERLLGDVSTLADALGKRKECLSKN